MPRVPRVFLVTIGLALVLVVLPSSWVLSVLAPFQIRHEVLPVTRDLALEALVAAYPPDLFQRSVTETRRPLPVLAVSQGPYRHDIAVAHTPADDLRVGDIVVMSSSTPGAVLVGRVVSVGGTTATAETLLNPAWRSAVRIGTSSVDALLVGGLTPRLTLISKNSPIAPGDVVFSVDESLPYGLALGVVGEVRDASDGVLREATLTLPYTLTGLRTVSLLPRVR